MNDRDLWWKISIVGTLIALAVASITPLNERLKYGIDLAGGYSLLYEIDDTGAGAAEKATLSEKVMKVLRERVDPKGVYNLVWRPVGHNRLEIQMPRPSEVVVQARADYKKRQEELQATVLKRSDLMRAFARTGEDRKTAVAGMTRGIAKRAALIETAAKNYDEHKRLETEYEKRAKQIEADNLSRADVEAAVKTPPAGRAVAFDKLIRGLPQRRVALDEAAKAWEELIKASATTMPAPAGAPIASDVQKKYDEKKAAYEAAVQKVLDVNVDPTRLTDGVTIDQVVGAEEKLDASLAAILATNIDLARLQPLLDAKPTEQKRKDELRKITDEFPGLATTIEALAIANDQLKKQVRGEGRLEDPADLQRLLKGAGVLEFRILAEIDEGNPTRYAKYREKLKNAGPRRAGDEDFEWFEIEDPKDFMHLDNTPDWEAKFEQQKNQQRVIVERFGDKYYVLSHTGENHALTHRAGEADWSLRSAHPDRDEYGKPSIAFELDERGGDKFAVVTRLNKGLQLCIFLDDQAISHATIQSVIRTQGRITGNFQLREVQEMVKKLEAGSLPRKLKDPPISVRAIGPSLGEANRTAGLKSAKYAAAAVAIFMIVYYFYAGGVAVFAVGLNVLFTLSMMAIMGATMTLAGIAGLVLSVGMAVDANVLINERIREETVKGSALRMAIRLGYERAFSAILDSNITTILTCVILYLLGSEEIKGFALTLGIGVFINLFTAYFVTRLFFELIGMFSVPKEVSRNPVLFGLGFAVAGAALYGLGYWKTEPALRDQSVLILFGKTLMYVAPAVISLFLLMRAVRAIHGALQRGERARMPMLHLVPTPKISWIGLRYMFFTFSIVITVIGGLLFFRIDPKDLYDIEFLGGTEAQIDLKNPGSLDQTEILARLKMSGDDYKKFADAMKTATVTGGNDSFVIQCPGVPASRLEPVVRFVVDKKLSQTSPISYEDPASHTLTVRTKTDDHITLDQFKQYVGEFAVAFDRAAEAIASAQVQATHTVGEEQSRGRSFEIVSLETNKDLVVDAIMLHMRDELDIQPRLSFKLMMNESQGNTAYFPLRSDDARRLSFPIKSNEAASLDLQRWKGGVAFILDQLDPPQKLDSLKTRLRSMRLQPGFEGTGWRESDVFGLQTAAPGSELYQRVMVVVVDEGIPLEDPNGGISATWISEVAEPEMKLISTALTRQTSLSQITQFDKQISREAQTNAIIAVVLSWLVIILYLWFRFGNIRWGLAAVIALIHDVFVALGALGLSFVIADTAIGRALLVDKFRLDMAAIAALLTVIGYSVNDTIIVFDRIRENRGRQPVATIQMVDDSISQTLSRTLLTVFTVLLTIVIMYIFGGRGIHGFNYVLLAGVLTGAYSSIAVASQFLIRRRDLAAARAQS